MKGMATFLLSSVATFRPTMAWVERVLTQFCKLSRRIYTSEVPADGEKCKECGQGVEGKITRSDIMKYEYYCACAQEFWHLTYLFFKKFGVNDSLSWEVGKMIGTVIEYVGGYRIKIQDIFAALDERELIKNPRKELKRVLELYLQRDHESGEQEWVATKSFIRTFALLSLVLYIPKIRDAFLFAVKGADWDKLRPDEIDIYWAMLHKNYDSFGLNWERRKEYLTAYLKNHGVKEVSFTN